MNNPQAPKGFAASPLWLVGFRPFFSLAFVAGALLPLMWAAWNGGMWQPSGGLFSTQWHAHEMLFGFGWAVLGGFLLTASKNWVGIRGMHGSALVVAACLWILERVLMLNFPAQSAPEVVRWLAYMSASLFILFVGSYLLWTLIRFHRQDSFRDNYFFIIALPAFLLGKWLLLTPEYWVQGYWLTLGLFRVAFVVMFERTMTQFMKNAMGITLYRNAKLDLAIKGLVLLSAFQAFLPLSLAAIILAAAAAALFVRFCLWSPLAGMKQFNIAIMYVGYFAITLHLGLEALRLGGIWNGLGTSSIHIFTFLCMGVVIPGMLIRIGYGHTGRKINFTLADRIAISTIAVGAFFRVLAPMFWPQWYVLWVVLSALSWTLCFTVVGFHIIPFLWQARVDGREH